MRGNDKESGLSPSCLRSLSPVLEASGHPEKGVKDGLSARQELMEGL